MEILKKGTRSYSIFMMKCPKCQQGDLFQTPTFSFQKPFEMPEKCNHCGQSYMPAPGFYYGSMFISYIIMGWFCLGFIAFFHWYLGWSTEASFALLILVYAILFVWIFRFARSAWIGLNVRYDPSFKRQELK